MAEQKPKSMIEIIKEAGYVMVVRCKDCKHSVPSSENFVVCTAPYSQLAHTTYKPIDWYCPEGERKDGDEE